MTNSNTSTKPIEAKMIDNDTIWLTLRGPCVSRRNAGIVFTVDVTLSRVRVQSLYNTLLWRRLTVIFTVVSFTVTC